MKGNAFIAQKIVVEKCLRKYLRDIAFTSPQACPTPPSYQRYYAMQCSNEDSNTMNETLRKLLESLFDCAEWKPGKKHGRNWTFVLIFRVENVQGSG